MTYKLLDNPYRKNGFSHYIVQREGDIALYHKTGEVNATRKYVYDAGYEVVRIKRHDGYTIAGVPVEPSEVYPSAEHWGVDGYTYTGDNALENAKKRFNSMVDGESHTTPQNVSSTNIEVIKIDSNEGGKKRGRQPVLRSPIQFPTNPTWTMKDILVLNPEYQQPTLYLELKKMIGEHKLKVAGTQKSPSGKGKSMILYSVWN